MLNTDPNRNVDRHFKQAASSLQHFLKLIESLLAACLKWKSTFPLGSVLAQTAVVLKGASLFAFIYLFKICSWMVLLQASTKFAESSANALSKLAVHTALFYTSWSLCKTGPRLLFHCKARFRHFPLMLDLHLDRVPGATDRQWGSTATPPHCLFFAAPQKWSLKMTKMSEFIAEYWLSAHPPTMQQSMEKIDPISHLEKLTYQHRGCQYKFDTIWNGRSILAPLFLSKDA